GLLQDETSPFNLPYHLARPLYRRIAGDGIVAAIGLGAGPLTTRSGRWLVRKALRRAAVVTVRDEPSRQLLESVGVRARTTADLAFGLPIPDAAAADRLVVCLRPWSDRRRRMPVGSRLQQELPAWFLPAMARALDATATASGLPVHFVALQADRDHEVHEQVAAAMHSPTTLVRPTLNAVLDEVGTGAVVVSMRYHGVVAATLAGRPSVAIGYSPKVDALALELGAGGALVPWSETGVAAIADSVRAVAPRVDAVLEGRARLQARERGNDDALDELLTRID
ncbi:MAG TPA: polysaccharide pyruvyl transferase family protein, partial [Acidimicrobiales bacterium]|nr:polysaccharide pyruvyl transferase family protein [Acidimicrobiales bacterium]